MAHMLYYLPDKYRKMISYYGIFSDGMKEKLVEVDRRT